MAYRDMSFHPISSSMDWHYMCYRLIVKWTVRKLLKCRKRRVSIIGLGVNKLGCVVSSEGGGIGSITRGCIEQSGRSRSREPETEQVVCVPPKNLKEEEEEIKPVTSAI